MPASCYQLASPPGTIRLWIAVHPATVAPAIAGWQLDGAPLPPARVTALRPMASVRSGALLTGNPGRAFSGVYEITHTPGPAHDVTVTVGGEAVSRRARPLPERLQLDGSPLTVLLASCYHAATDAGLYGALLPRIVRGASPDLCLFMGDQVYLDLPTLKSFRDDPAWLADKFEQDYVRNWLCDGYREGLGLGPIAFLPDDHEYWNNFPHPSPFIENSWSPGGRDNWRRAARACYEGFQLGIGGALGDALSFDVRPLSFLLLDTRSERDTGRTQLISPAAQTQLTAWAHHVAGDGDLIGGVIATGQSLLEEPVNGVTGSIADYSLANYEQPYATLLTALTTVLESGKQVLLLTGDVHWGRVASVRDRRRDVTALHEVITSPASLVETVGADQTADLFGAVKGWFGRADPWPRHGDGKAPPAHLPHSGQRFRTNAWLAHRGNQCAVLRMTRRGTGIAIDYTLHPLALADVPPTTGRFHLLPTT